MTRDTLFLLAPGFEDAGRRQYCPECAEAWGLLHYFPAIRETLDIVYQPLSHPREALVALLGDGRWNCPTLVLAADAPDTDHPDVRLSNGRRHIDSARGIGRYYAARFGTPAPR